jgi:hypothetical protein
MDGMKLRMALASLQAFVDEMPGNGVDIEEKYVDLYHKLLADIQTELECDLSYYRIPSGELARQVTSTSYGPRLPRHPRPETTYSQERYCDSEIFLIALKGAVNFINGLLTPTTVKRIIGFRSE